MNCEFYRRHELGKIGDIEFEQHSQGCAHCKMLIAQDEQLLASAKLLKEPLTAPLLWAKIENSLRAGQQSRRRKWQAAVWEHKTLILRLAAVLVVALATAAYFYSRPEPGSSRLLADAALKQVEEREMEYQKAIAGLERLAQPRLAEMDADLMLLYRDRLATIDAQIDRCKEAAARNPANAHIRRYLLAALQDRQQTLKEVAEYRPSQL